MRWLNKISTRFNFFEQCSENRINSCTWQIKMWVYEIVFKLRMIDSFSYESFDYEATLVATSAEDCLILDIYRPSGITNAEIVVFINGGGYQVGDLSTYNGMQFAKDGFVAIVIQYR